MKRLQLRRLQPLVLLLLFITLTACIGDIGSSSEDSQVITTTTTDASTQNGISVCEVRCAPVEGGWEISRECEGQIQDGPTFAAGLGDDGCAWPPEEEEEVIEEPVI